MPVTGKSECQPIGDACPPTDWPANLPAGVEVVYVKAGAVGGDGTTSDSPLGTIADALVSAPDGAILALAKGTFIEDVVLDRSLQLWGACAGETIVRAPTPDDESAVIKIEGKGGVTLKNLRIDGDRIGVWVATTEQPVLIDGVLVVETVRMGVRFVPEGIGASAGGTLNNVAVRDTRSRLKPMEATSGVGLGVEFGTKVTVTGSTFERNRFVGVYAADPGSVLTLEDVLVRDTMGRESDGMFGDGLAAQDGATVQGSRCIVERNREIGLMALTFSEIAVDSTIDLSDLVVRDMRSQASDGKFGRGVVAADASDITLTRAIIERTRETGVLAYASPDKPPPTLTLTDVLIRDTTAPEVKTIKSRDGQGLGAQDGAILTTRRLIVEGNRDIGVFLSKRAHATMEDLVIRDTKSTFLGKLWGRGLNAQSDSTAFITRGWFQRNRESSVFGDTVPTLSLTDVTILDTLPEEGTSAGGRAIAAQNGTGLKVLRALVQGSREAGIFLVDTDGEIDQTVVEDTEATPEGAFGDGIAVEVYKANSVQLRVEGSRIERSARVGISNSGAPLSVGSTTFVSNAIDISSDEFNGHHATFENLGGNVCGCPDDPKDCQVLDGAGVVAAGPLDIQTDTE